MKRNLSTSPPDGCSPKRQLHCQNSEESPEDGENVAKVPLALPENEVPKPQHNVSKTMEMRTCQRQGKRVSYDLILDHDGDPLNKSGPTTLVTNVKLLHTMRRKEGLVATLA